jgi:hypothetical protein
MEDWKKVNCIIIILLGLITGFKYIIEYTDILNNNFLPDGIRFFLFAIPVALCHLILLFISINKKSYPSIILDIIAGISQLLVVGLRGHVIVIYGMIMSGGIILLATFILIIGSNKKRN